MENIVLVGVIGSLPDFCFHWHRRNRTDCFVPMYVWEWHLQHSWRSDRLHVPHLANKVCNCCLSAAWPTCHRDRQSESQRSEPAAFYWLELVTWPLVLTCCDRGSLSVWTAFTALWFFVTGGWPGNRCEQAASQTRARPAPGAAGPICASLPWAAPWLPGEHLHLL